MENERDDQHSGKEDGPPASEDLDRPNMQNQGGEGSQSGGTSGQPIGGNDSSTGSGTTLSQGADFGRQSATGQAQQNDGSGDTLTTDQSSESSSQSSQGGSQGEGFIGSQGSGSDDYLQDKNPSGENATGGSDFANQGRGALDEEEDESGEDSSDGGSL